jgi:hypothetical protein
MMHMLANVLAALQIYLGLEGYGSSDRDLSYIEVLVAVHAGSLMPWTAGPWPHCFPVPAAGLLSRFTQVLTSGASVGLEYSQLCAPGQAGLALHG